MILWCSCMKVSIRTLHDVTLRVDTIDDGQFEAGLGQNAGWQNLGFCRLKEDGYIWGSSVMAAVPLGHDQKLPAKLRKLVFAACG